MDMLTEKRMEDLTDWKFVQSELHGMAALQEAVCLDSLNRSELATATDLRMLAVYMIC